jgi:glucosamine--fructose-6-phosphate aminotransferase (isomerizing)
MCGVVGYIGKKQAAPILIDGLHRLEYRGYDSAGIAVIGAKGAAYAKDKGKVATLQALVEKKPCPGSVGIAHTRWATHGVPSAVNAHPHFDEQKEIFLVHNGIVENYVTLREELEKKGYKFRSTTDTEVLVHLIRSLYKGDLMEATARALRRVKGTYGILVIHAGEPEKIVAARNGSPLILGVGDDEYILASDASAIISYTKQVIYLEDGELVQVTPEGYQVRTLKERSIQKTIASIDWDEEEVQKQGHQHFMLKEMMEEGEAVENSLRGRTDAEEGLAHLGGLSTVQDRSRSLDRLQIVACGSAYYAGMVGKYMLEEYAEIPTDIDLASEYRYRKPIIQPNTAVIAVSQSGETADTLAALREAQRKGALGLGIVNAVGSTIARETDAGVYNHVGPEIGVASTKVFVSQMTILVLFTLFFGRTRQMSMVTGQRIIRELRATPKDINKVLEQKNKIKKIAKKYAKYEDFIFLGRKYNYPIALEGALKLKEISYIHAEGYAAGELKHGPLALIEPTVPTFAICPKDSVYEKTFSNLQEVKARKGKVIAVTTVGNTEMEKVADDVIYIPKKMEMLSPILSAVPVHLFAYYVALALDRPIDRPRNLAKSVTVE